MTPEEQKEWNNLARYPCPMMEEIDFDKQYYDELDCSFCKLCKEKET